MTVFGPILLSVLVGTGLFLMTRSAYRNRAALSAAQMRTTYVVLGGLMVFALIWVPWEVYTLVMTLDRADHITAWHAFLLQDLQFRIGFSMVCGGVVHLMAHLSWRRYPLWPSGNPSPLHRRD